MDSCVIWQFKLFEKFPNCIFIAALLFHISTNCVCMFPCLNIHKFCLFYLMIAMCTECLYCISLMISTTQLHFNNQLSHGICHSPVALSGHYHLKLYSQIPPLSLLYTVRNSVSYSVCLADKMSLLLQQWHNCYKSNHLLFKVGPAPQERIHVLGIIYLIKTLGVTDPKGNLLWCC